MLITLTSLNFDSILALSLNNVRLTILIPFGHCKIKIPLHKIKKNEGGIFNRKINSSRLIEIFTKVIKVTFYAEKPVNNNELCTFH